MSGDHKSPISGYGAAVQAAVAKARHATPNVSDTKAYLCPESKYRFVFRLLVPEKPYAERNLGPGS